MSLTQGSQLGPTQSTSTVKPAGPGQRLIAGKARDGGGVWVSSSGDQMAGGGRLRDAGARPRRVVAAAGPNMAGIVTGVNLGSDRSSGEVGNGAVGHGGANGWVLWPPGDVLSTVTRSESSQRGCGHDGDVRWRRRVRPRSVLLLWCSRARTGRGRRKRSSRGVGWSRRRARGGGNDGKSTAMVLGGRGGERQG